MRRVCLLLLLPACDAATSSHADLGVGADLAGVDLAAAASNDLAQSGGSDGGAPAAVCTPPISLADVSQPKSVLSGGSCNQVGLQQALDQGGVITFSCGAAFTLTVTSALKVTRDTVLDGADQVTLSGGGASRILSLDTGNFEALTPTLTVQRLRFSDGKTTDANNTPKTDQGGAAIYRLGGALQVVNCRFANNTGPMNGQDVAGGAIYSVGGGQTIIVGSSFDGNSCSNGGALGILGSLGLTVVNSRLTNNRATGSGANPGNGGNGGALSFDGSSTTGSCSAGPYDPKTLVLCGDVFANNHAGSGALGGAVFRTVDTSCVPAKTGPATIDQCFFDGNDAPKAGALYLHQVDLTLTSSTVSRNRATAGAGGGLWLEGGGGGSITVNLTNVTVAGNQTVDGLGGGFFFGSDVGAGTFRNVTIAGNQVTTTSGNPYAVFGAGLVGAAGITLANTIIANNDKPIASNDAYNCQNKYANGGGNLQWPAEPTRPCSDGATAADPMLGALADNGGPTPTLSIAASSAAAGKGAMCPAADQRGHARLSMCASGAYEP